MAEFVALYRGRTISEAELIAVSVEPRLVERFFTELLGESKTQQQTDNPQYRVAVSEVTRDE